MVKGWPKPTWIGVGKWISCDQGFPYTGTHCDLYAFHTIMHESTKFPVRFV